MLGTFDPVARPPPVGTMSPMDDTLRHLPLASRPVIVGIDGSAGSRHALLWAAQEARARAVPLRVVHAWTLPAVALTTPVTTSVVVDPSVFEAAAVTLVEEAADLVRSEFGDLAPALSTDAVQGWPIEVLTDAAVEGSLLVVGSHGRSALAHVVLGSVAEACLRHSSAPVVVVPEGAVREDDGPVVVGVDDSAAARDALRWAALEAGRLGRRLVVVHAQDVDTDRTDLQGLPDGIDAVMLRSGRQFLDHLLTAVAVIGGRPRSVAWRVVAGPATRALVAASGGAAMLVIGSPQPHGIVERVVGSTGLHCVREARCPVVVVPAEADVLECAS